MQFSRRSLKDAEKPLPPAEPGERRVAVLFLALTDSMGVCQGLSLSERAALLESWLARACPPILRAGGRIESLAGETIKAIFEGPECTDTAVGAGIEVQSSMVALNEERKAQGKEALEPRFGIDTGPCLMLPPGLAGLGASLSLGPPVDLAFRLMQAAKSFVSPLLLGEEAFKTLAAPADYKYRFLGKVKIEGKEAPVSVFEIFDGVSPELFERKQRAGSLFEQGMLAYYQKDFGGASYFFKLVLEILPEDGAAAFYLDNCSRQGH